MRVKIKWLIIEFIDISFTEFVCSFFRMFILCKLNISKKIFVCYNAYDNKHWRKDIYLLDIVQTMNYKEKKNSKVPNSG